MRKRIFIIVIVLSVFLFLSAAVTSAVVLYRTGMQQTNTLLKNQAEFVFTLYSEGIDFTKLDAWADSHNTRITLLTKEGQVLFDTLATEKMENHAAREEVQEALREGEGLSMRTSETLGQRMMYYAKYMESASLIVRAAESVEGVYASIWSLIGYVSLISGAFMLLALGASVLLLQRAGAPLQELKNSMLEISQGNMEKRVYAQYKEKELSALATAFNKMADDLSLAMRLSRRESARLRSVLAGMSAGVLALDQRQNILMSNADARKMLGISTSGNVWHQLRSAELRALTASAAATGELAEGEITLPGAAGRRVYLVRAAPLYEENHQLPTGTVAVLSDITERKRLESMRSEFTANVTHELKTPLTSISGFVETLLAGALENKTDAKRFLEIISLETARLGRLIDDILTLSAIEAQNVGDKGRVELKRVAEECLEIIRPQAKEKGITVTAQRPKEALWVLAPRDKLVQLFLNLLDNACKYNKPGGSIELSLVREDAKAALHVRDTGIGIPKAQQERVFERFFRVDKSRSRSLGGTGLGLSIVKHIALSLGGSVRLESKEGEGSTFTVLLPAEENGHF